MSKKPPQKRSKELKKRREELTKTNKTSYDPSKVQLWMGVDGSHGPAGLIGITGFENLEAAIMRGDFDEELGIADLPDEMALEELEELNKTRPDLELPMEKYRAQQRIQDRLESNPGTRLKALPAGGIDRKQLPRGKPEKPRPDIPKPPRGEPPDLVA